MRSCTGDYPECICLHSEVSARRKRWCCGSLAGHFRNPSFALWRASAAAARRSNNSVADIGFTHSCSGSAPHHCFKLRSQSASGRLAIVNSMILDPILQFHQRSGAQRRVLLALHEAFDTVPSASAMRKPVLLLVALLAGAGFIRGEIKTPENAPIEITSTGETTYENGLATARDNVAIHVGDTDIYADYAQYNSTTHEVELRGHVRIYRDKPTATVPNKPARKYNDEESDQQTSFYRADSGIYNIDTKRIRATNMRTEWQPYFLSGQNVSEISENAYLIQNGTFSTHDSPNPDFHLQARTIRVYEKDRVIFRTVTLYVGKVPVFWWPYLYQSLNDAFSFTVTPAYLSSWGPSILTQVTFPITDDIKGRIRLDYRGLRGVAVGFDPSIEYGKDKNSWAKFKTYYIQDQDPDQNQTAVPRKDVPTGRYRLSLEDRTNFSDDIYGIANLTKLSDQYVMQDFYQGEFRVDPVPDNVIALTKTDPFYTLKGITRFQANEFFTTTERLPEVVLDIKRHALFGGPIFYEGETGFADLRLQ